MGPEEETALRRSRTGQDENIKMDQHEEGMGCGWVDLVFLGQVA